VYQAIASCFAQKLKGRRSEVEKKVVFSNLLNEADSIYFFKNWRFSYRAFRHQLETYYDMGLRWIACFDLSAFYDTISHELLIKMVSPQGGNQETWQRIRKWLECWSASSSSLPFHHGIPQGPIASDFLAESILLPIDEDMLRQKIQYVRYADDIRIFARTENDLYQTIITLEHQCRNRGLIPHADKYAVKEATSSEEAMGSLPSLSIDSQSWPWLLASTAEQQFEEATGGRPQRIKDKASARFVLFHAPKSQKILTSCLRLIPRHPEQIDAFSAYLSNYDRSKQIENAITKIIKEDMPYDSVRGELWLILARIASGSCLEQMAATAKKDLAQKSGSIVLNWGAMAFLLECERKGYSRASYRIKRLDRLIQTLLMPHLDNQYFKRGELVSKLVTNKHILPGILLAHELVRRDLLLSDLGLRNRDLSNEVQNCLREVGLIRRRRAIQQDQIGQIIARRFATPYSATWKTLLKREYNHALSILNEAENAYDQSRSNWIQYQNSFNEIVVRHFINELVAQALPGRIKTVNVNKQLISIGNLVATNAPLTRAHPNIANPLRNLNQRRNRVPASHSYSLKGGAPSKHLTKPEQRMLHAGLSNAYTELVAVLSAIL